MASFNRVVFGGSSDTIPVPFGYLDKSHVHVLLDGSELSSSAYSWPSGGQVKISAGNPASGVVGEVRRVTPPAPLVSFAPGNLDTTDLNVANLQSTYLAEEARDKASDIDARTWSTAGLGLGGTIEKGGGGFLATFDQHGNIVAQDPQGAIPGPFILRTDLGQERPGSFFGMVSVEEGSTADNTAKLKDAMESGYVMEGRRNTYLASANVRPAAGSFRGLKSFRVRQLNPDANGRRTLDIRDQSNFDLVDVRVDGGGLYSYASGGQPITNNGLAYLYNCSNFTVDGYTGHSGGPGNGIAFEACTDFNLQNIVARDLSYDVPVEVNDWINGILITGSARFSLNGFRVRNLKGKIGGVNSRKWSRGIAIGNNSSFTISDGHVSLTDVNFDFTGSLGNEHFAIGGLVGDDAYTWGFKFANGQRRGVGKGLVSRYAGLSSYVFSAPNTTGRPLDTVTQDMLLDDIIGYNPGATTDVLLESEGWVVRNGVTIMSPPAEYAGYPQGIRIGRALMHDDRGVGASLMKYGYYNPVPHGGTVAFRRNELSDDALAYGYITDRQAGFHYPRAIPTSSDTVANIANDTWTDIGWNTEGAGSEDSSNMHSTSSSLEQINIWESGWYVLDAEVEFSANGSGRRGVRFADVSSGTFGGAAWSVPNGSGVWRVHHHFEGYLTAGQRVKLQAYQDSGASRTMNLNGSRFSVRKVGSR